VLPLRALIVDDEASSRDRLRRILATLSQRIEVVGEAANATDAELLLASANVDIVFLDIVLPGMDGLSLAARLGRRPAVVFVTAYADRAVDAFDTFALHYVLKPVEPAALERALVKVLAVAPPRYPSSVPCRSGSRVDLVDTADILFFQSDHKYTLVRTRDEGADEPRREHLLDLPLVALEDALDPSVFRRVSRSAIVNAAWLSGYTALPDGRAELHFKGHERLTLTASRAHASWLRSRP
jgi:two-component system response regulator AlgR